MGVALCINSDCYMFNYIGDITMKDNFVAGSKAVAYICASALMITTAFCMAELSLAAITVLLSPDYNCTSVPTRELP